MERYTAQDGIVTDTRTGLQREAEYHGPMSWHEGEEYARNLRLGRFDDWRLPTRLESESLLNLERSNPASDFPGMPSALFWSLSSCAYGSSYAWRVSFYDGGVYAGYRADGSCVRCVRG